MRVTNSVMIQTLLADLRRLQFEFAGYNKQLSSGRRINRPSDDAPGTTELLALQQEMVRVTHFGSNISEVMGRLEATDSKLNDMSLALANVLRLTEQGASDPTAADGRRAIANEIRSIQDQLRSLADSNIADRYLFAGTRTTRGSIPSIPAGQVYSLATTLDVTGTGTTGGVVTDPSAYGEDIYIIRFTDATGSYEVSNLEDNSVVATGTVAVGAGSIAFDGVRVDYNLGALPAGGEEWTVKPQYVYNGTEDEIELQVDENTRVIQNVPGNQAFGGASGVPGNTIFDDLVDLRLALLTDDTDQIRAGIDMVNGWIDDVSLARAGVGGRISNLRTYEQSNRQRSVDLLTEMAELTNADLAETISRLSQSQAGIQAAMQSGVLIGRLSLFDFLR